MTLKRILLLTILVSLGFICRAQTIAHINLVVSNDKASVKSIDVIYNNTAYCVDLKGKIQDATPDNNLGIAFYDVFDGPDNIGKLKSIGNVKITYYDRFDAGDNIGKLKSIGSAKITYYDVFDGGYNIGKLKSIGNTKIIYYDRFDVSQPMGTVKSVSGSTPYLNVVTI